jgi:hypothetical protein
MWYMVQLLPEMVSLEWYMCIFKWAEQSFLEQTEPTSTMKIPGSRSFPLNKYITSHWETMCYMILLLTQIAFFREIHVFPQLNSIGWLETNKAYLHLEKAKLQEVYLLN